MPTHRFATEDDLPALRAVMAAAIERLQGDVLDPAQVAASHSVMGLETQLVAAARDAGFIRAELMATLAGEPLYRASGYREIERTVAHIDGVPVPLVRMGKALG